MRLWDASNTPSVTISAASASSPRDAASIAAYAASTASSCSRDCFSGPAYRDPGATLADLREAVTILEEIDRTARRVYGNTNPLTIQIKLHLENARADLRAHETPSGSS